MADQLYQLVGTQDPSSRIDRWVVEGSSADYPEGKVLELDGEPMPLNDEQYAIGSRFLRLRQVDASEAADVEYVDQPGVNRESLSTDNPPDPGTDLDVEKMNVPQLRAEARRIGADVPTGADKEDLQKAITAKREEA